MSNSDFAEQMQMDGLLQQSERAFLAALSGFPHVKAQLLNPLVLLPQNPDNVGRRHNLKTFHDLPLV
ncbi:hypothetical protein GCM10010435_60750 [Winogradskya consettensis]|uniref:Uncharacterized protein n=1 Tax=Winogradskya consettensis TaxID=113560 RepID=A0A919SQ88_9ACTN|nr:hypothetical protein Aco04nite_49810 [Actinoplanes consettensis]